jgi:hypothetical protein
MLQIKNVCGCFLLSALCSSSLGHSHALTAEHRTEEQASKVGLNSSGRFGFTTGPLPVL